MTFQSIVMKGDSVSVTDGVYASEGYFDGVPGSFAVYRTDGGYSVEEHTGDVNMPAAFYPI